MMKKIAFFLVILSFMLPQDLLSRRLIYKEEFYRIYYLPQKYVNDDLTRAIHWLSWARVAPFAPPIQALKPHEDEQDYIKYQALINMHIDYLLTKNTAYLAARFDKHRPVYFNKPYAEDILKSLDIAEYLYDQAEIYWQRTLKQFADVRKMKGRSELDFLEDLVEEIRLKEVDLGGTVARKKANLEKTRKYFLESLEKKAE